MKRSLLPIFIMLSFFSYAGTTDTISIYSFSMHQSLKCVVIKPGNYSKKKKPLPVLYLLHGYSGCYSDWIRKVPALKDYADRYNMMIVCPDGGNSSWYFDSPLDSSMRYETYVSSEVVKYIDSAFRTIRNKNARAITGLSMGGHGAFFMGLRHAETFGAIGSMSGGLDINASNHQFEISKRIGDTLNYAQNWKDYSDIYVIDRFRNTDQTMLIDCGMDDFYFEANKTFHEKLVKYHIKHDFTIRPGNHNWEYWSNAIEYHLLFFRKYFDSMKKDK